MKNEFKGTPGPWEVGDEFRIYSANGLYIARHAMGISQKKIVKAIPISSPPRRNCWMRCSQ